MIRNVIDPTQIFFGGLIHGGFDLDRDGFADVVISPDTGLVGTPYPNAIYVYHGSANGLLDPPSETVRSPRQTITSFAESFALGDLNGDDQVDLATGDSLAAGADIEFGIADVFLGNGGRLGPSPAQAIVNPQAQREGWFGRTVVVCDFNADGYDERAIAATGNNHPSVQQGVVYLFPGAPAPPTAPTAELTSPTNQATDIFGLFLSCGR